MGCTATNICQPQTYANPAAGQRGLTDLFHVVQPELHCRRPHYCIRREQLPTAPHVLLASTFVWAGQALLCAVSVPFAAVGAAAAEL
jgi:hypothetical protein